MNPETYRGYDLKRDFGITVEQFAEMLKEQNGVCAICGEPETAIRNGKLKHLAVDHHHETGEIRGLLCGRCNPMLGYAGESIERLTKAIEYLRRYTRRDNVVSLVKKDII